MLSPAIEFGSRPEKQNSQELQTNSTSASEPVAASLEAADTPTDVLLPPTDVSSSQLPQNLLHRHQQQMEAQQEIMTVTKQRLKRTRPKVMPASLCPASQLLNLLQVLKRSPFLQPLNQALQAEVKQAPTPHLEPPAETTQHQSTSGGCWFATTRQHLHQSISIHLRG